jgi:hypothetical protein
MPCREDAHSVALQGAIEPVAHAAVAAACAGTARRTRRIVHADTTEPHGAPGHAHPFGFTAPAYRRFARLIAGAKKIGKSVRFIGLDIGILRRRAERKGG